MIYNILFAGVFDFLHIDKANKEYQNKNYLEASKEFAKIDSEQAKFNQADSLYRAKRYEEAKKIYQSISDKKLEYKKLHNIGNCNVHLGDIKGAIDSYQKALKIKDDKDTKYNLELLKKEQEKKKNKKNKDKNKQDKKDKNKQDKNKQDEKDKNKQNKKEKQKKQDKQEKQKKDEKNKKAQKQKSKEAKKQPPISNMEERKWQKMLNKRNINTLMLPIKQGKDKKENKNNI
jgi:Ca-activated chloride channel family protein